MRSKLNYLISVSLNRKIKTKWFLIANIILAIVIIGVFNIDSIISFFGGDFNEKTKIYVIDNTAKAYDVFKEQLETSEKILNNDESNLKFEVINYDKTIEDVKKLIEEDPKHIALVFAKNIDKVVDVTLISESYIDTIDYQLISSAVNNTKMVIAIQESNISMEEIRKIYSPVEINRIYLDETKKSEEENMEMIMTSVFPTLILPFFMLTIFLVQMIGAEVNDEKTTRGMEIIISNVSPKTHFFAKVISGNLFVLFKVLYYSLWGYWFINKEICRW